MGFRWRSGQPVNLSEQYVVFRKKCHKMPNRAQEYDAGIGTTGATSIEHVHILLSPIYIMGGSVSASLAVRTAGLNWNRRNFHMAAQRGFANDLLAGGEGEGEVCKVLFVAEGDFSFSASLLREFKRSNGISQKSTPSQLKLGTRMYLELTRHNLDTSSSKYPSSFLELNSAAAISS